MLEILKKMKNIVGKNLISAVKFGSEGEPNNILFVFKKIDFCFLNKIKPLIQKNKVIPLIFTREELFNGADVFPLEFLDIKYPHETIYGEEIIDKIKFNRKYIRTQIEFELRSKLIHLRENYIGIKKDNELKKILNSAIPSLMPLFYGLLILKGTKPPTDLDSLFKLVSEKYDVNLDVLKNIKEGRISKDYAKDLIECLDNLVNIVDKMR